MNGIGKSFEHVQLLRRKFEGLIAEGRGTATWAPQADALTTQLQSMRSFGSNPGDLKMLVHVPDRLPPNPALVVALHGCGQSAAEYERGTGWSELADRLGFVVVYPEQQSGNNPNSCFSWFLKSDHSRDGGEALSIRQMVEHAAGVFHTDRRRVYVTGLSAGGAMTSVMLATYPETFAAGAIIAGLPYGCAGNVQEALSAMFSEQAIPAGALGDRVRAASTHSGPWPRVSVWHGTADAVVKHSNAHNIARQWADVHGIEPVETHSATIGGHRRRLWTGAGRVPLIETVSIDNMAHGVPIAAAAGTAGCGASGPFFLDVGISSTQHIARFWGLEGAQEVEALEPATAFGPQSKAQSKAEPEPAFARERAERIEPAPSMNDPAGIIEAAMKAAGLSPGGSRKGLGIDPAAVIAAALKAAGLKR